MKTFETISYVILSLAFLAIAVSAAAWCVSTVVNEIKYRWF